MDGIALAEVAARHPKAFFLVNERRLVDNYQVLARCFTAAGIDATLRYCVKTNNDAGVLAVLARQGSALLASHLVEVELDLACGFPPSRIALAGEERVNDSRADGRVTFEYFALRCVPRVDREEFVNVGLVLYSPAGDFLAAASAVRDAPLRALAPEVDVEEVRLALATIEAICRADQAAGPAAAGRAYDRFRWLAAPRSTVVQPGPIHGGITDDPPRQLAHLLACMVG